MVRYNLQTRLKRITHTPLLHNSLSAGINPVALRGSKTGVYIGVSGSEAGEAFSRDPEELLGYSMTGCQRAMFANRLSYFFDFNGKQGANC